MSALAVLEPRGSNDLQWWEGVIERFWSKVDLSGECWEWQAAKNRHGYGVFGIGSRTFLAHRIADFMANGDFHKGQCSLHRCDSPSCVRPDHLFRGTRATNVLDMVQKGRVARGEIKPNTKLNPSDIREIRLAVESGEVHREVATRYGVHASLVSAIALRTIWRHVV